MGIQYAVRKLDSHVLRGWSHHHSAPEPRELSSYNTIANWNVLFPYIPLPRTLSTSSHRSLVSLDIVIRAQVRRGPKRPRRGTDRGIGLVLPIMSGQNQRDAKIGILLHGRGSGAKIDLVHAWTRQCSVSVLRTLNSGIGL